MKFETGVAVGRGATGEVFRARDPETGRDVALKLFPPDAGDSFARRQREAEAQRRLDHPSICTIYEVGTTGGGRGYIAMRFVDGEPLDLVAARLPLRRRVELVRTIADAVAHAHSHGLVHRDLKPSNLLVEESDDGTLTPFVLDFGLVRIADETRLTETGRVLGTPGYLSPEQARGEVEIDARSDVFSLGAILYQVLVGSQPFEASSEVGALLQVLEHDPPLAQHVRTDVPPELAHIAQKALEKDPRRRYADAGALRRDLDRYLAAGQVSARSVGRLGLLVRRIERRPTPWAVGGILLLVALAASGWALRNRFVAQQQTRDAERFARRSTEIESQLRFLELLPERTLDEGRGRLAADLDALRAEVESAQGRAAAAGEYAVGRTLLAFGRADDAIDRLRAARAGGFDDPAAGLSLGLALLEQSRARLHEIDLQRDPAVRAAARTELRAALREEAMPLVERAVEAGNTNGAPLLAQALAALLLDRYDEADRLAQAVLEASPWLYEADLIRADVRRERAAVARFGGDEDAASTVLADERAVLQGALVRAPSAARLYERLCENHLLDAQVELARQSPTEVWGGAFEAAERACKRALDILPDAVDAGILRGEILWRRALMQRRWSGPEAAQADAEAAVAAGRAVFEQAPGVAASHLNLANALLGLALVEGDLGTPLDQVSDILEDAAEHAERGLDLAPGAVIGWQTLGNIWNRHALLQDFQGLDPIPSFERSLAALEGGLGVASGVQASRILNVICGSSADAAYYLYQHPEIGSEGAVGSWLRNAEDACRRAIEIDPDYLSARSNLGLLYWTWTDWRVVAGASPLEDGVADRGHEAFRRLLEMSPGHVSGINNYAGFLGTLASWRLDRTEPFAESADALRLVEDLREARALAEETKPKAPADLALHIVRLAVLEAATLCADRADEKDTDGAWEVTSRAITEMRATSGVVPKVGALRRAEAHRRRAECALLRGRHDLARAEAALGLEAAAEALAIDPGFADVEAERARLLALGSS